MAHELSVIVPVHNEEPSIRPFYDRTKPILESMGLKGWEIVFINDASTDGSLQEILRLHGQDPRIKVITLTRNFGYHAALMAGLTQRDNDLYAIIDVDCEDPPELLADFVKEIEKGAYTAYGIRSQRDEPRWIVFLRWLFYWINRKIADGPVMLWMAEFGMMTRVVRDAVLANKTTFPFVRAELGYVGYKMAGVPYFRARRQFGATHYNLLRMAQFAVGGFLASSTFPLRLAVYLSVALVCAFVAAVIGLRLPLSAASQLASIFSFAYLAAVIPMLSLYLARTYKNVSGRPVYYMDPAGTRL